MAIETAEDIYQEVLKSYKGTELLLSDTISYINKGIKEIAGSVLLPELLEVDTTVLTVVDTAYASLPTNYMRCLHYCYSNTHTMKIKIYDDVRLLYREFSQLDLGGRVVGVARKGDRLYYQRIPSSAETLRIHYYKYPTALTVGTSQPDCLPEFLVRPLLVNYVAKEIFSTDELGLQGPKVDTEYHEAKFLQAMAELNRHIGPEPREPQYTIDDVDLEGYL